MEDLTPADFDFERMAIHVKKSHLHHEMRRGCSTSSIKHIRIHEIRHSHINLLIDIGFSSVAIENRVENESIDVTYHYVHIFLSTQVSVASN